MSNANGLMAHVAFAKGTWPKRPLPKMQPEWPNMVFAKVLAMHFWSSRAFVLVVWLLWQKLDKEAALWLHHCLWQKSLGTRCCSRKQNQIGWRHCTWHIVCPGGILGSPTPGPKLLGYQQLAHGIQTSITGDLTSVRCNMGSCAKMVLTGCLAISSQSLPAWSL